jgi:transglutaminase-like putative cysteine protease
VTLAPTATATESYDVFGNAITICSFAGRAKSLVIDSTAEVDHSAAAWPVFSIAASAIYYPFRYSEDEWSDLGQLATQQYPDPQGRLVKWARSFILGNTTDTLSLLKDLSAGVTDRIRYEERDEEGTQGPAETLDAGRGSCRDLATLFTEAARSLGFGSRIISGYLLSPDKQIGPSGAGTTHAWSEVYLPGAGWIGFDPTNRSLGGKNVIPVAAGRSIRQVMPVVGTFAGPADALEGMSVHVEVAILAPMAEPP